MSESFDVRKDCPIQRKAMGAYVASLLEDLLPPMRVAARGCGYAITVHGSLCRDIDLVAVPWASNAQKPEVLVDRLLGVIAGTLGRACTIGKWSDRPHGRRSLTIITPGDAEIDLSIMPLVGKGEE